MYDITFLILNYNSYSDLVACVDTIKKNCENYTIVIVDNGSKQSEVEALELFCKQNKSMILLKSKENLGFTRGNNIGFRYIKENIPCRYLAMINSDILLTEAGLVRKLDLAYEKYQFAVLGPDILPSHSNPMVNEPDDKKKVCDEIKRVQRQLRIMKVPIINCMYLVWNKIRYKLIQKKQNNQMNVQLGCELHGCFWVFSQLFTLDGLCEDTFLYGEEHILAKQCRDANMTMIYEPAIKVIHNESRATKKSMPGRIARKQFFYENYLQSLQVLLNKYEDK